MMEDRINIVQGEYAVSGNPNSVIHTLLGSCVAVCLFDLKAAVGGMNHFLLPGEDHDAAIGFTARQGAYLMEIMINGLFKLGASRSNMTAKIFGGANTVKGIAENIGAKNIDFARRYLHAENIPLISESVGGNTGRRIQFWPCSGRVMQAFIAAPQEDFGARPAKKGGDIELFC